MRLASAFRQSGRPSAVQVGRARPSRTTVIRYCTEVKIYSLCTSGRIKSSDLLTPY